MKAKNNLKTASGPRPGTRFPGIVGDAATLGVEKSHLYRVLTGARESRSLLARYKALKKEQKAAARAARIGGAA